MILQEENFDDIGGRTLKERAGRKVEILDFIKQQKEYETWKKNQFYGIEVGVI